MALLVAAIPAMGEFHVPQEVAWNMVVEMGGGLVIADDSPVIFMSRVSKNWRSFFAQLVATCLSQARLGVLGLFRDNELHQQILFKIHFEYIRLQRRLPRHHPGANHLLLIRLLRLESVFDDLATRAESTPQDTIGMPGEPFFPLVSALTPFVPCPANPCHKYPVDVNVLTKGMTTRQLRTFVSGLPGVVESGLLVEEGERRPSRQNFIYGVALLPEPRSPREIRRGNTACNLRVHLASQWEHAAPDRHGNRSGLFGARDPAEARTNRNHAVDAAAAFVRALRVAVNVTSLVHVNTHEDTVLRQQAESYARYVWRLLCYLGCATSVDAVLAPDALYKGTGLSRSRLAGSYYNRLVSSIRRRCMGCGWSTTGKAADGMRTICEICLENLDTPTLFHMPKMFARTELQGLLGTRDIDRLLRSLPYALRHGRVHMVSYVGLLKGLLAGDAGPLVAAWAAAEVRHCSSANPFLEKVLVPIPQIGWCRRNSLSPAGA